MRVHWTPQAKDDLRAIGLWIARERPRAAATTRELVVARTPFLVAYRVRSGRIEVLAVLHGAREWPESL